MFDFGDIVFVSFPFSDLAGVKVRPALVVSCDNERRVDIILAFISSRSHLASLPDAMPMATTAENGLKTSSIVRFDKLVTLEKRLVLGECGKVSPVWLKSAAKVFRGVFGFEKYEVEP